MASATLAFFSSSLTPTATLSLKHKSSAPKKTLSFSNFGFLSPHSLTLSSRRPPSPLPKSSEFEPSVIEVESSEPNSEALQVVEEPPPELPKREEIFAVVMIGSRQYIVFPGRYIYTQRLKGADVNDKIILNRVLLVGTKTSTYIGKPVVPNAAVHAVVEEQGLNPKVMVFKYKKKKNYRRNIGHRQPNTRIRITGITGYQDSPAVTLDS
ncbi:hypothetical protein VitviT2T_023929 [Vitis vinifera]|uniref:50S ribosomal protein L21, chloroplastic n=3 Tax=Vitis vinifera TaxID=29760 RepID=A0ABY9DHZ7_VITVI|eukprot:XP_002272295.1 PREDICTED: 50S ribosomal protein L21, chloroplastic [Vitis vinifera]